MDDVLKVVVSAFTPFIITGRFVMNWYKARQLRREGKWPVELEPPHRVDYEQRDDPISGTRFFAEVKIVLICHKPCLVSDLKAIDVTGVETDADIPIAGVNQVSSLSWMGELNLAHNKPVIATFQFLSPPSQIRLQAEGNFVLCYTALIPCEEKPA